MMLNIKDTNSFNQAIKVEWGQDFLVVFKELNNLGLQQYLGIRLLF